MAAEVMVAIRRLSLVAMIFALGCGGPAPAPPPPSEVCGFADAGVVDLDIAGDSAVVLLDNSEGWTVWRCALSGAQTELNSGEGMGIGLSASPDGRRLLVSWMPRRSDGLRPGDRHTRRIAIASGGGDVEADYVDELIWFVNADAWDSTGTRWVAFGPGGKPYILHTGHGSLQLALKGHEVSGGGTVWPSDRWPDAVYVVLRGGVIYRLAPQRQSLAGRFAETAQDLPQPPTAEYGDVVYVLTTKGLTRLDLQSGRAQRKPLPAKLRAVGHAVSMCPIGEADTGQVVIAWTTEPDDPFAAGRASLYRLTYSDMHLSGLAEVPSSHPEFAATPQRLWIAWTGEDGETIVSTVPLDDK